MPRLSVILVAHDDASLLEASRTSVLSQGRVSIELLTTADASAAARNRSVDAAQGDHVWFVEPRDLLVPGSLATVAAKLDAIEPDVLVVHHSTIDDAGRIHEGPHRRLLRRVAEEGTRTLQGRPGLADTAP